MKIAFWRGGRRPSDRRPIKIAFIGTGVMGGPIAGHLVRAGHEVTVYNRTKTKAEAWSQRYGGHVANSAEEAVAGKGICITCVGNDDDLREIVLDSGHDFLAHLSGGGILIDHSTVSVSLARELAVDCDDPFAVSFVDAPVSGGQAGAENGTLSIMCGGKPDAIAAAEPIMRAYAARIVHVGGPGAGQQAKMVNQIAIAGVLQGLSEALRFAQKSELDLDRVLEAISGGAAQSWQMVNRWGTMAKGEFDFGFAVDWMRKDLGLALDEARRNGALLPMTALIDQFYAEVQAMGGARQDTSALVRRLPK